MITARPYIPGEAIREPGIYSGVPIDIYHSAKLCDGPSLSSSGMRTIVGESPEHYFDSSPYNPDREEKDETAALRLGRATHHLLLGEAEFTKHFILRPETIRGEPWQGNKKICKEWLEEKRMEGLLVLKKEEFEQIIGMSRSLSRNPIVKAGLLNGLIEHTLVWKHKKTGVWLKARPDGIPVESTDIGDLKTTTSVHALALERTVADYAYYQQGALIRTGFKEVLGLEMSSFNLVFVESKRPYSSAVVAVDEFDLDLGTIANEAAIQIFAKCIASGEWPGPGGTVSDAKKIMIPSWSQKQAKDNLGRLKEEYELDIEI